MTFIDLFAGVGGFRKGMELAGHECKGFCEWDKYAAASYISMHLITEEQRAYLATLDKKKRQKEILKDEYLNGEWYSNDIRNVDARSIPKVDCFCFGAPCQDFSIAGQRKGLEGDRSSLIREVFRVIREEREEDRPEWLIYENVKGMLSSNRGGDFLSILMEMDELGYDTEWQIFNSKNWGVPQNRERVYTLGHFRAKGRKKVFPIGTTDGKDNLQVGQIGQIEARRDNPQRYRVYSEGGVSPCLNTMGGGGLEPHIPVVVGGVGEMKSNNGTQHYQQDRIYDPDGVSPALSSNLPGGGNMITVKASQQGIGGGTEASHTLMARDYKGIGNQEMTAVILKCSESTTTLGDRSEISQTQSRQNMMLGLQTSDRTGQRYV